MTLRDLTVYKKVCETGSLTQAASELYMTQPAVSHVIRTLEEETGVFLFDRVARKVILNPNGELFLKQAAELLESYERLRLFPSVQDAPPVRIGSNITIANFRLPDLLTEYRRRCPDAPFQVTVDTAACIYRKFLARELDIALLEGPLPPGPFEIIPLGSYRILAACAKEYFSDGTDSLTPGALVRERLLLREKGSAVRDIFDSALLLKSLFVMPVMTSVNSQALVQAAIAGLGITLLPEPVLNPEFESGRLRPLSLEELSLCARMQLVYHSSAFMADAVKEFIRAAVSGNLSCQWC